MYIYIYIHVCISSKRISCQFFVLDNNVQVKMSHSGFTKCVGSGFHPVLFSSLCMLSYKAITESPWPTTVIV